jgi:hypothetical protein
MVDVKEIKLVKLAPFTLMSSSVQAILAFIGAILMLIVFGIIAALVPQANVFGAVIIWLGVGLLIIYPIGTFFTSIAMNFFSALLYNSLVPRLGGIKLGLEGSDVTEIPVVSFALILAFIEAIWAFIIGLSLAALIAPISALLSSSAPVILQAIANATNSTGITIPTGAAVGTGSVFLALFLIIGLPIAIFVILFIVNALAAIFYNYLVTRVTKIKLEFVAISETLHELKSIPVLPAALTTGIVFAIFGFIEGLISLISLSAAGNILGGFEALVVEIVYRFILWFIVAALATFIYNYLAPRIGGIKLDLQ